MNKKLIFLVAMTCCLIAGWILGYFRLPLVRVEFNLLLGFLTAMALTAVFLIIHEVYFNNTDAKELESDKRLGKLLFMLLILLSSGAFVVNHFFIKQKRINQTILKDKELLIDSINHQFISLREIYKADLLTQLINDIHQEVKSSDQRILSDNTINRIETISNTIQPYRSVIGDSLSLLPLSPERGLLLLNLIAADPDSAIFTKIKSKSSFAYADLAGANLKDADLSHIDLRFANLKDAKLQNADLKKADLQLANLWGAKLQSAKLNHANLRRATLENANMDGCTLINAILDGVNGSSVWLRKADLSKATIQYADFRNALLMDSNMERSFSNGTDYRQANLSRVNFNHARLKRNVLDHANLTDVSLYDALIREDNWFDRLLQVKVKGAEAIMESYVPEDSMTLMTRFILKPVEK